MAMKKPVKHHGGDAGKFTSQVIMRKVHGSANRHLRHTGKGVQKIAGSATVIRNNALHRKTFG